MGVDEDTAAVIHDGTDSRWSAAGAVTVVDGQHLVSNAYAAKRTAPLLVSGAVLHVLPAGSQFDLATRTLLAHQTPLPDHEVLEARAAEADLRPWPSTSPPTVCPPPTTRSTPADAAGSPDPEQVYGQLAAGKVRPVSSTVFRRPAPRPSRP